MEAIHIRKEEQDKSMNRDGGIIPTSSYLTYLWLLTVCAVAPSGQSLRRRQQRLPKRQQQFRQKL